MYYVICAGISLSSFWSSGSSHTAGVRRTANDEKAQAHETSQPKSEEKQLNKSAMTVTDKCVVILTETEEKLLDDISKASVGVPVPASLKRLLGKRTSSQRLKGARGDGQVFTNVTIPTRLFKPVMSSSATFRIVQENLTQAFTASSTSAAVFGATYYVVNSLDQISALTALFDQYRITMIEVWFLPASSNTSEVASGTVVSNGHVATVIDYDDATALTAFTQALDYVNVVSTPVGVAHYRKFVPHATIAAGTGTMNVTSPWCDSASPSIQHFGLKYAFTQAIDLAMEYDYLYRMHTEWRNIR